MHTYKEYTIPYTICFCVAENKVLLINRKKEPYIGQWNGLGGKIEEGETMDDSMWRELQEEAGIESGDKKLTYVGVVTWDSLTSHNKTGMFAYILHLPKAFEIEKKETHEGFLEWKDLDWVLEKTNKEIAENVRYFLPEMLLRQRPMHYHCEYSNGDDSNELTKFTVSDLS